MAMPSKLYDFCISQNYLKFYSDSTLLSFQKAFSLPEKTGQGENRRRLYLEAGGRENWREQVTVTVGCFLPATL